MLLRGPGSVGIGGRDVLESLLSRFNRPQASEQRVAALPINSQSHAMYMY